MSTGLESTSVLILAVMVSVDNLPGSQALPSNALQQHVARNITGQNNNLRPANQDGSFAPIHFGLEPGFRADPMVHPSDLSHVRVSA